MKTHFLTALIAVLISTTFSFAQKNRLAILFKDGPVVPEANITAALLETFNQRTARYHNKVLAVIQFQQLPSEEAKKKLAMAGIELLEYIPNNAYTVSIAGRADVALLQRLKARALVPLSPQQKMHSSLSTGAIPGWAQKAGGTVDVDINVPKTFSVTEVTQFLKEKNIDVLSVERENYGILTLRIAVNRLAELAGFPFVAYVEPIAPPDAPLNYNSRVGSRVNMVNASVANGGKGLNGEGVVMGIGDVGNVTHADLSGRTISRASNLDNGHATYTHGNAAGAGIINEMFRGYAAKATVVSDWFQNIIIRAPIYVKDYGMVVTNNSYGGEFSCEYNGTYNMSSQLLDQQAFDLPELQHVFAAGNSGGGNCPPFPAGFKTVLGGYQAAKNIICVGNSDDQGNLFGGSSKGPVKDGRIKPEIVADGTAVTSSWAGNRYHTDWGTSASAPFVAGGLALLYQRYRQLHNGANPGSALMKAAICNGASDRGNEGPDYSYGFGYMNVLRSMDILENNHYFFGSSTAGSIADQTVTVPANVAQVKVMLYWHDPAASLLSSQALVNDLDLEVVDPAGNTVLPRILDTAATRITATATTGADHINNIEQVVINNPTPGNYTVRVKGIAIAQNPSQDYVVVYDVIPVSLQVTYPVGGEGIVPGENMKISWDHYGDTTNTFTLQYSADNGASWNDIANTISGSSRFYIWKVPAITTEKAQVRILKNGTPLTSASHAFAIVGQPAVSLASVQCEGYIAVKWNAVSNATDYEVMLLRGDEMVPIATTAATAYTLGALSKDSLYWVSVRARINGQSGRRAVAISRQPNNGTCLGTISDNDLRLDSLLSPASGRKYTSTELATATPVTVRIKNLDDKPATGFSVSYSENGTDWITEAVTATIAAGGVYTHTFATPVNFSAIGSHMLLTVVKNNSADMVTANDTLVRVIKQLDNAPINLSAGFTDDLERADTASYQKDTVGLAGADRYDFTASSPTGRLQTFVNTGISYSGSQAFTLDKSQSGSDSSINYLTGTFNLSGYHTAINDLRLDFRYLFVGQFLSPYNRVWIRGKDTDPWIEVYRLATGINVDKSYKLSPGIDIADSLKSNGQDFSSSFQIRWGQNAKAPAYDKSRLYSIDDIHLYEAFNDMQLVSIDSPVNVTCNLSNAVPLRITVRNSAAAALSNIPVKYSVNGSAWITETIASVPGHTVVPYTFTHPADLSGAGTYTLKVVVDYPADTYRSNDTATAVVHMAPLVTAYPYLQNFEGGDGGWYAEGTNSSWEYGTPASGRINGAASGAKAWKTRLSGNYNDEEYSYLYSPCFDISRLAHPALSFSTAMDLEDCGSIVCDGAWVEYTTDNAIWKPLLDTTAAGTNWFNAANKTIWSKENYTRWHVATMNLPRTGTTIRLRFVMKADEAINKEGIAIDDIHIYDNAKGIYAGTAASDSIVTNISGGNNWIDVESGGKLMASIQPNNQDLGNTLVRAYINTAAVRDTAGQYYHDRNLVIQPQNASLTDSVLVRLYYTDAEVETLMSAATCATCTKPVSAYDMGIAKYSSTHMATENGTMQDDAGGYWTFIPSDQVTKVPFDKGYYAEFKTRYFSEFWLSKTAFANFISVPVQLSDFTAKKLNANDVWLQWQVANEGIADRYEIEAARSEADFAANRFEKIGSVKSENRSEPVSYTFTDAESGKTGVRYYRIKVIEKTGSVQYSAVRSVLFTGGDKWTVFPNPSTGKFYFLYQVPAGEKITLKVSDAMGRTVYSSTIIGDGFAQKQVIDLSGRPYASGVYLLQAFKNNQQQSYKLYKQ